MPAGGWLERVVAPGVGEIEADRVERDLRAGVLARRVLTGVVLLAVTVVLLVISAGVYRLLTRAVTAPLDAAQVESAL